jgi:hypothetical protein
MFYKNLVIGTIFLWNVFLFWVIWFTYSSDKMSTLDTIVKDYDKNIVFRDCQRQAFEYLHTKLSQVKSAREVNITFEHCSVYPKIVTGKVQVAYFENVFSDWSIFKEVVLLSNQHFKIINCFIIWVNPKLVILFFFFTVKVVTKTKQKCGSPR